MLNAPLHAADPRPAPCVLSHRLRVFKTLRSDPWARPTRRYTRPPGRVRAPTA